MPTIHYQDGNGGIATLTRDTFLTHKDAYAVAYNQNTVEKGVADKVKIPHSRIVRVEYGDIVQ